MKPYFKIDDNVLFNGDCLEVLKELETGSVDLIVSDPPYGYAFMGKDWDKSFVSIDIWKECYRVLKDGAFAFIMSSPRQDCLSEMIVRLSKAGFNTSFTSIYWSYASGFPKSGNISKLVDKKYKKRTEYEELAEYIYNARLKLNIPQKEISKFFPSKTGGLTGCVSNWEKGMNVPTSEQWEILKRELKLDNKFDWLIEQETKRYEEAEREVVGKAKHNKGFDWLAEKNGIDKEYDITKPATPQAKELDGSYTGFQPKPAVEIVIVVMKPLSEKTYVEQAMKNKHGCTWLDDCRIPYESGDEPLCHKGGKGNIYTKEFEYDKTGRLYSTQGRFPANLLVSDDVLNDGKVSKSSASIRNNKKDRRDEGYEGGWKPAKLESPYNDTGSFSRYFDLDKWWTEQIKQLPETVRKCLPFLIVPKASKGEKNKGCDELEEKECQPAGLVGAINKGTERPRQPRANIHPTAKPIKLMSYLITLGSRTGDTILDPFLGSGTTCIAADILSRKWIGIEREKEYIEIAKNRIEDEARQIKMF